MADAGEDGQEDGMGDLMESVQELDAQTVSQNVEDLISQEQLEQDNEGVVCMCGGQLEGCTNCDGQSVAWTEPENKPEDVQQPLPPESTQTSSTEPPVTGQHVPEPCWYCMRSFPMEEQNIPQLHLENEPLSLPPSGDRLNFQQDPRPHFGVAHSSRSTSFPLWDSEGPTLLRRTDEEENVDAVSSCPHCFLGLPPDTLRWHEAKCLLFEGLRSSTTK